MPSTSTERNRKKPSAYPLWAPRFWHGLRWCDWYRLLRENGFRVHPLRWGLATTVSTLAAFNSVMAALNSQINGARVEAADVPSDPVFIVGHWRSGTTYLHELMSCDPGLASPTTYQCFAANHFLLTEAWLPKLFWFLMPAKRPMDNVRTGWDAPQEDEFALCALGAKSPYLRMAFPNEPRLYLDYLDLRSLPESTLLEWQSKLELFLKSLSLAHRKRLILKSPTHTARLGVLAKMFPEARFLHIVREPKTVYSSTMNLWQVLDEAQGLQIPRHTGLKEYVLSAFERMYRAFESDRRQLDEHRIFDIRYEDLVQAPLPTLQAAYQHLGLGDFGQIEPALRELTQRSRDYKTNTFSLAPEEAREVMLRWNDFAQRYGYADSEN